MIIDNQARIELPGGPAAPGQVFLTDDPATGAFPDDTRVYYSPWSQWLGFTAFWHREVDIDLRVIDPCGNAISPQDVPTASCAGATGFTIWSHSCSAPSNRLKKN